MRTKRHLRTLEDWCDDVGGNMTETTEDNHISRDSDPHTVHRCVLNNEGHERWDSQNQEYVINDKEYVELRDDGMFRAVTTDHDDTITVREIEWENPRDSMEEQRNYQNEEVRSVVFDGLESMTRGFESDKLTGRPFGGVPVGDSDERVFLERRFEVHPNKSPHEIQEDLTTQRDMLNHHRMLQFNEWKQDAQVAIRNGEEPPSLRLRRLQDPEQWLKQNYPGEYEEYEELTDQGEEFQPPEHDPLDCPDNPDLVEIDDGITVEGEVDSVSCARNETVVQFEGDDGETYVVEGTQDGSEPIRVRYANSSRHITELEPEDIEILGVSAPTTR